MTPESETSNFNLLSTSSDPEHQSMNSDLQSWCDELEMRMTKSLKYVDFLYAFNNTNGKDLTRSLDMISKRGNSKTEWVTTWLDIWAKHAH